MTNDLFEKVKVHTGEDVEEDTILIKVKKTEDGIYINWGEGYYLFTKNTNLGKRTVRQLINKEFNERYVENPTKPREYPKKYDVEEREDLK